MVSLAHGGEPTPESKKRADKGRTKSNSLSLILEKDNMGFKSPGKHQLQPPFSAIILTLHHFAPSVTGQKKTTPVFVAGSVHPQLQLQAVESSVEPFQGVSCVLFPSRPGNPRLHPRSVHMSMHSIRALRALGLPRRNNPSAPGRNRGIERCSYIRERPFGAAPPGDEEHFWCGVFF